MQEWGAVGGSVSRASASVELTPGTESPSRSHLPTRGHFVHFLFTLFCFPFLKISAPIWTVGLESGTPEQGIEDGAGGGSEPQEGAPHPPPRGKDARTQDGVALVSTLPG